METPATSSQTGPVEASGLSREMLYRMVGWVLNLAAVVALSVGAHFFQKLEGKLDRLDATLHKIDLNAAKSAEREAATTKAIEKLEKRVENNAAAIMALKLERSGSPR